MKSGLILIATIFGLLIVASIKHLPFIQFFGTSSILIVCIALMAVTIKFGPKPVLAAFAGKDASTAKVIIQSIWIG